MLGAEYANAAFRELSLSDAPVAVPFV